MVKILLDYGADARLGKPLSRINWLRDYFCSGRSRQSHVMAFEETQQQCQKRYEQVLLMLKQAGAKE